VYSIEPDGSAISDYYTKIKGIWEELDDMMELPKLSTVNDEVINFLGAFSK